MRPRWRRATGVLGRIREARAFAGLALVLLLAACSGGAALDEPSALPGAGTAAADGVEVVAGGLVLPVPPGWSVQGDQSPTTASTISPTAAPTDPAPWALTVEDNGLTALLVSPALPAADPDQARQLASALLGSALPDYTETGVYTAGSAVQTPTAPATGADGGVIHLAFTFSRNGGAVSGRAWVVPVEGGWTVVALLADDDAVALALEQALVEGES